MAITVGSNLDEGEMDTISAINTTPLVDVMLVLLIIFLITIPAVLQTVPVKLPQASNIATVTKPENVLIAVDKRGKAYWNDRLLPDYKALLDKARVVAVQVPQPEVHLRADKEVKYEYVGRVIVTLQRAGIVKVGFITEPILGQVVR
jgi:biopolymer transport protein ExbD